MSDWVILPLGLSTADTKQGPLEERYFWIRFRGHMLHILPPVSTDAIAYGARKWMVVREENDWTA